MFLLQETSFILADNGVNFEITGKKITELSLSSDLEIALDKYKLLPDQQNWYILENHCYIIDGNTDNPKFFYRYIAANDKERVFISFDKQIITLEDSHSSYIDIIKKHDHWVENNIPDKIADNDINNIDPEIIKTINNYGYIDKCSKYSGLPNYILYFLQSDPDQDECSQHDSYCTCEENFADCLDSCIICKDNLEECNCLCHDFRDYGCQNNDHCGDNCEYSQSLAIYNITENEFNNIERQYLELDPDIKTVTIHYRSDGLLEYWAN